MTAFQNATHHLPTTTTSWDRKDWVDSEGIVVRVIYWRPRKWWGLELLVWILFSIESAFKWATHRLLTTATSQDMRGDVTRDKEGLWVNLEGIVGVVVRVIEWWPSGELESLVMMVMILIIHYSYTYIDTCSISTQIYIDDIWCSDSWWLRHSIKHYLSRERLDNIAVKWRHGCMWLNLLSLTSSIIN